MGVMGVMGAIGVVLVPVVGLLLQPINNKKIKAKTILFIDYQSYNVKDNSYKKSNRIKEAIYKIFVH